MFEFCFGQTPILEEADGGMTVKLSGEESWVCSGDPMVPVRPATILLPQGTEITSVEVSYPDGELVVARDPLCRADFRDSWSWGMKDA